MTLIFILMVLIGFCGIFFGFWGQNKLSRPYDTLAAIVLPLSLILSLTGVLLLCVPHFFS